MMIAKASKIAVVVTACGRVSETYTAKADTPETQIQTARQAPKQRDVVMM